MVKEIYRLLRMVVLIFILGMTGCSTSGADMQPGIGINQVEPTTTQSVLLSTKPPKLTLTVFAAASLTGAFEEIGKDFENAYPGVNVRFNFAGSQILRVQIEQGAAADIFASADHANMDLLVTDKLLIDHSYQDFVTNKLVVILPPGNPANVKNLADLARPHLKLILADSSVPAGNYARKILLNLSTDPIYGLDFNGKVLANLVSNETDVKQVVTKVELGEADAGIVYISDAIAAPDLSTIPIPDTLNVTAHYPIGILNYASEPVLAEAFIAYVTSPAGQEVMAKWGFNPVVH
jgi:molybdate transport system substrate-binding protein